jgi:DNA invertase Pin-like site-specific DNA recombinase
LGEDGSKSSFTGDIDTHAATRRFFFLVTAGLAEMERELIFERIRAEVETTNMV